ncbi:uncharacterized protein LOC143768970 [Ranitomeya variabilis]|uniref:uncharacterized protein LOC143768970 n=1 Tax=Ranitomeya variabilis TaxID=490064 RepID=UPI004055C061
MASECEPKEEEEEKENSSLETKASEPKILWSNPLRKKMADSNMYMKYSLKTELLSGFVNYLSNTLSVQRHKQEAENVARFLYFMDNDKPPMEFVFNIHKTNEYFSKLLEIGNTHQTVFNYLKSLKRFLDYMKNSTDLIHKDKKVYDALCIFVDQLGVFQKRISKGISKENVAKKQKCLRDGTRTPNQLENILLVAKPTFMQVLRLAKEGENLHVDEKLTILQYLEALIIVRKLQRPGVVQHMKVDEWKDRIPKSDHVGITVYEHKTAANQVPTVILTKEEESIWIEASNQLASETDGRNICRCKL